MDVSSALTAYDQKLTMCLSSSSFFCRLLGSKILLFWVPAQIPLSGELPIRGDGLRGSYNWNWVGRWTVTLRRGRVISCTLICSCSYSACWNEGISIDFAFFCSADWWASEEGAAFYKGMWHRRGLSHCLCGAAETQQELWLLICAVHRWTIVSLMSYCIPESGVQSEKSNIHLLCQGIPPYHSYIYLFWKKNVCIRYYLLTSNTSNSDIDISVGIIRLKT